ncbi:MAG TPA: flagellar export protein FliJ [Gammaproteobacteria bacterium]|nr:flagellar export protein FliJ [Gammaproteobacteria bacterium]
MSRRREKRMQPVRQVAEQRERAAVQRLGEAQRELERQRARLAELRAYREQYTASFARSGSGGLSAGRMQDYRAFLERLNAAIRQQETLIERCSSDREQSRRQWVDARSHQQAVDKLLARYHREAQQRQARREQQQLDEHAGRTAGHARGHKEPVA